jgi:hypothetical protein
MVPRISKRGHSFVGAAMYYLHDKKADTDQRVAWTYTHNLPTDDAEKAFGWMAFTAMSADRLKQNANVVKTGRKSNAGSVYSYSLAWHPDQNPDRDIMKEAALDVLEKLGLKEHEAVLVAHTDTEHPHVHVVCNLVHPENGKTASPSYDYLIASRWAESHEKSEGKIRCEQRVINNEKRSRIKATNQQAAIVKHREPPLNDIKFVQDAYKNSSNGLEFQQTLKGAGFILAKGDRRGFVLVDNQGKISSLSRQLKGQRSKDIKARLKDVSEVPMAQQIAKELQEKEKNKVKARTESIETNDRSEKTENILNVSTDISRESEAFLQRLDAIRNLEQNRQRQKNRLENSQEEYYKRKELIAKINALQKSLADKQSKEKLDQLADLSKNLKSIDERINEQNAAFEKKSLETRPEREQLGENGEKKQDRIDSIKKKQEQKRSNRGKRGDGGMKR